MICGWDIVLMVNFVLSLVILALGCFGYARKKEKMQFNIGVAFGLFGVSHLLALLGLEREFDVTVVLIRIFGYLIIVFTLYNIEFKLKKR